MKFDFLNRFFTRSNAKCDDQNLSPMSDENMSIEDEEIMEEKTSYVPPFQFLFNPIKMMTLNYPSSEISGFKFSMGVPLSPNFMVMQDIHMAPKGKPVNPAEAMMGMQAEKDAFYTTNMQYVHGTLTQAKQDVSFILAGRWDSNGRLDATFLKHIKNLSVKIQSSFMNSNLMYSSSHLEFEHQGKYTKQTLVASSHVLNYNIMERIGKKLLVGLEMRYNLNENNFGTGYAARYEVSPDEKLYAQYSGAGQPLLLGSMFKLNPNSNIALELEFGGMKNISKTMIGYRKKAVNYTVSSSMKSDGEMKSIVEFSKSMAYKLKLSLGGNLFKEDFRAGYQFCIGQTD